MREFLFAPAVPTPNGPLHLGHAAGPYLIADFLRRAAERSGHRCVTVCGSDVFDSYVLLAAHQQGLTPEEICRKNSDRIRADLASLDISIDVYIDPLDPEQGNRLAAMQHRVYRGFRDAQVLCRQVERLPFFVLSSEFAGGCWLHGRCPRCGAPAGSFVCEDCYAQYRPEDLLEPECRLTGSEIEWRETQTLAFKLAGLDWLHQAVADGRMPIDYAGVIEESVRLQGHRVRVSVPGTWGIPMPNDAGPTGQVFFTSTTQLPFGLLAGEYAAELLGRPGNVFDPGSDVTTVRIIGSDGAVHHAAGSMGGAILLGDVRPFDHLVISAFYRLCGSKFSTSRRHAVWVRQATVELGIPTDIVRWYLARTSPARERTDFDPDDFAAAVDRILVGSVNPAVRHAFEIWSRAAPVSSDGSIGRAIDAALDRQEVHLSPATVAPQRAATAVEDWCVTDVVANVDNPERAYWWLKGLALLAYPILPRFGHQLWHALGHDGEPSRARASETPVPRAPTPPTAFEPLTSFQTESMRPAS
jgi:methionyl-tRNA synthetase